VKIYELKYLYSVSRAINPGYWQGLRIVSSLFDKKKALINTSAIAIENARARKRNIGSRGQVTGDFPEFPRILVENWIAGIIFYRDPIVKGIENI